MAAQFLLTNVVPASPGEARSRVKDSGSDTLLGAAPANFQDTFVRIPPGYALFMYGDSKDLKEAFTAAAKDYGVFGVCSDNGQNLDKHFVRFDFGVTNATLLVLATQTFWGGVPAAPWSNVGGALADAFFTRLMRIEGMPPVMLVQLPDIVDHAKANHANAIASVW